MHIAPSGPCPARIMIVGEFPGEQEFAQGQPFVGYTGQELSKILQEAGIMRSSCFMTYAIRQRPFDNNIENFIHPKKTDIPPGFIQHRGKWVHPCVAESVDRLKQEIAMCQPHVIIALGNAAMWALTGNMGITSWRGSVLQTDLTLPLDYSPKVIPMYTPGMVMKTWSWRPILVHDLKRAKKESATRILTRPEYNFVLRPDFGQVHSILTQLINEADKRSPDNPLKLANDIETRAGHIACIGIAWSKLEALCIPLMCVERPEGYWNPQEELQIVWMLRRLLTHRNVANVGQNFLYDMQYYHRHLCFEPRVTCDTMIAQHSMFSAMQKGLDFLSSMYCEHHEYWKDEGKEWDPKKHDEDQYWQYNCKDAVITFEVDDALAKARQGLSASWPKLASVNAFQQELFWPVLHSMNLGLRVDTKRRANFALELMEETSKREAWLYNVLGQEINIKSPVQMKDLFLQQLKQRPIKERKTGMPSCNDEALRRMADREPLLLPLVRKISELRSIGVFLSTFINAPLDADGKMRCSYNIAGTDTYRFNSKQNAFGSGMNLQNVPKGGELGDDEDWMLDLTNVRSLFIPDPGHTFFDIDLASADLRIVVWEADEPEYKAMLLSGADPYTEIAKEFYHDPSISKKDPRRQTFKSFAHGTHYLGTAKGLAERLGLSVHDAEKTQKWYFGRFPRIKKWQDDLKDQVFKRRMVENIFGYRMFFFDRIDQNTMNQAAAWIPQSTVACLINRAYVNIYKNHPDIQVLLQVHDSLAGQFRTDDTTAVDRILSSAAIALPYSDPLIIPVGCKTSTKSWGDCED